MYELNCFKSFTKILCGGIVEIIFSWKSYYIRVICTCCNSYLLLNILISWNPLSEWKINNKATLELDFCFKNANNWKIIWKEMLLYFCKILIQIISRSTGYKHNQCQIKIISLTPICLEVMEHASPLYLHPPPQIWREKSR